MSNHTITSWQMTAVDAPFRETQSLFLPLNDGEVRVKIAGCGVCHTDISFWHNGVQVRHELPLTLGHEISGIVCEGPVDWLGKAVVIPAVLPCGECHLCINGRSNICRNQKMPGNDFHGGFATHIVVPSRFLATVSDSLLKKFSLAELSVIADAVSTPYQVFRKSELESGDLAIVIGAGGIGVYGIQIAKALGGKTLVLDIREDKLEDALKARADKVINIKDLDVKSIKKLVNAASKDLGARQTGWKIFEMSGTKSGQELAFALITYSSTLSIVGFTMDKPDIRLSNLMAFDAKVIGTWGCRAELYPEILQWVESGKIQIQPFVQLFPMSSINQVFQDMLNHNLKGRAVLIPEN